MELWGELILWLSMGAIFSVLMHQNQVWWVFGSKQARFVKAGVRQEGKGLGEAADVAPAS